MNALRYAAGAVLALAALTACTSTPTPAATTPAAKGDPWASPPPAGTSVRLLGICRSVIDATAQPLGGISQLELEVTKVEGREGLNCIGYVRKSGSAKPVAYVQRVPGGPSDQEVALTVKVALMIYPESQHSAYETAKTPGDCAVHPVLVDEVNICVTDRSVTVGVNGTLGRGDLSFPGTPDPAQATALLTTYQKTLVAELKKP